MRPLTARRRSRGSVSPPGQVGREGAPGSRSGSILSRWAFPWVRLVVLFGFVSLSKGLTTCTSDDELVDTLSQGLAGGPLLRAVYTRVDTAASWTRILTPLGNYLIARPAARGQGSPGHRGNRCSLGRRLVFGVTANDLHIWSADVMLSQVHDYLGAVPQRNRWR